MADERPQNGSAPPDDPRLLIVDCMQLFGQLEDLVSARGGEGKGLGEKVHSLRDNLPEALFSQLLSVVNIRNKISHEMHKRVFSVEELNATADLCKSIRGHLSALPHDYVRPRRPYSRGPWSGPRHRPLPHSGLQRQEPRRRRSGPLAVLLVGAVVLMFGRGASCQTSLSELLGPPARTGRSSPESRDESAPSPRGPTSGPARSFATPDLPRPSKRPARTGKRVAKRDGDSWNDLVDAVESQPGPARARHAPGKTDPTAEEIDSVLGQ